MANKFMRVFFSVFLFLMTTCRAEGHERLLTFMTPEFYQNNDSFSFEESRILPPYRFFCNHQYRSAGIRKITEISRRDEQRHIAVATFDKQGRIIEYDYIVESDTLFNAEEKQVIFRALFTYGLSNRINIRLDSLNKTLKVLKPVSYLQIFYGTDKKTDSILNWKLALDDTTLFKQYVSTYDSVGKLLKTTCYTEDFLRNKRKKEVLERYTYSIDESSPIKENLSSLIYNGKIKNKDIIGIIKNYDFSGELITRTDSISAIKEYLYKKGNMSVSFKIGGSYVSGIDIEIKIDFMNDGNKYLYHFTERSFCIEPHVPWLEYRQEGLIHDASNGRSFLQTNYDFGNGKLQGWKKIKGKYNSDRLVIKITEIRPRYYTLKQINKSIVPSNKIHQHKIFKQYFAGNLWRVRNVPERYYYSK